ncbi:MAG: hypothetical protein LQ345_007102 [Seirophora villosa]|nr:MAG: hypothetical protein LQ345_007102 [Seirophora villosa]
MAAKTARAALGGGHTAGIFADMTVDGPEIGTLVVIVDKAKNLPNRKAMGKQDPYCAARLGKEAKKTETDKRGGQTPKWDQELRFTVHESPDYYQLKVSCFNDDKRTELIGETRIGLEDIIVPGGGQNDTWHTLHCKGRFAGEIRIELTYYDTRPKEEQIPDLQQEAAVNSQQEPGREGVGGPRGPKPLKRRPLPANPTELSRPSMPEHAHSSPLPQPTPQIIHQPTPSYPDRHRGRDHVLESTPPSGSRHQHAQHHVSTGSPMTHDHDQRWMQGNGNSAQDYGHQLIEGHRDHRVPSAQDQYDGFPEHFAPVQGHNDFQRPAGNADPYENSHQPSSQFPQPPHPSAYNDDYPSVEQPLYEPYNNTYSHSPPAIPHGYALPDVRTPRNHENLDNHSPRHSTRNGRGYNERSPLQQHSVSGSFDPFIPQEPSNLDDNDVPPPPPAHRTNSGVSPSPLANGRSHSESCAPMPGMAPLNIRKDRGSISNSPLSQVQTNKSYAEYAPLPSPSHGQHYAHPTGMTTSRHTRPPAEARDSYHRRSVSPIRNGHAMPASLVPGQVLDPASIAVQSSGYDPRLRHGQMTNYDAVPQYQSASSSTTQPEPRHAATFHAQSPLQALEMNTSRRPHRASAPVIQPQDVSPDPRIPMRKSVSPHPESGRSERRGSDIPFGPDSYDAFNPFVGSGSASGPPGARYETPEQAKEAALQHEREKILGEGPIIGSDGREIDPSDHLPTDTWAPEPESKAPKKTAQVNIRFRNSPQGAQPMPRASPRVPHDSSARPSSISTPTYSSSANSMPDNISPVTAARARLQKKTRVSPAQPNSSPNVPTVNTALQNPVLRSTASDYPLREHENYGYGSSPTYSRSSPSGIPPPLPGKVPIGMGQEDWRRDALSEELSRIDIGVGGGRTTRGRYHR